jgi:hypothetical protein
MLHEMDDERRRQAAAARVTRAIVLNRSHWDNPPGDDVRDMVLSLITMAVGEQAAGRSARELVKLWLQEYQVMSWFSETSTMMRLAMVPFAGEKRPGAEEILSTRVRRLAADLLAAVEARPE